MKGSVTPKPTRTRAGAATTATTAGSGRPRRSAARRPHSTTARAAAASAAVLRRAITTTPSRMLRLEETYQATEPAALTRGGYEVWGSRIPLLDMSITSR